MKTVLPLTLLILTSAGVLPACAAAPTYREPWRPQFHFTPATNWMNDPNGMVFYDGEYHLFYQFNPLGDKWGHMSWGHAVSKDLVRWEHLPVALHEENGVMIFSGSAVVDWKNTSGFGQGGRPPLVAIYTGHYTRKPLQNQQLAFSNDRGRTWTKYSGNPVLDIGEKDFRDPKVQWHEPTKRWIMALAWPVQRKVRFYASSNLKDWTHLSDFGPAGSTTGIWECPDLFPLSVEDAPRIGRQPRSANPRWVLIVNVGSGAPAGGSGCQYFVGDFDGTRFIPDSATHRSIPEVVPDGQLLADFEADDYAGWQATGEAFARQPARGALPNQQAITGFRGRGLVNTFAGGDQTTGTLTSPGFEITRNHLNFLIGGGNHTGRTCLNLLLEGRVVRTATGDADEELRWKSWDVSELRGRRAALEIVDRHTGGWGHVNVDHILLADAPARSAGELALWADYGRDFYAAVSWSDVPRRDGRRLWLGWMSNWDYANDVPTAPWRSAMSLVRQLTLRDTGRGFLLVQQPVLEMEQLRGHPRRLGLDNARSGRDLLKLDALSDTFEVEADLEPATNAVFSIQLRTGPTKQTVLRVDVPGGELTLDRTRSGEVNFHGKFAGVCRAPFRLIDGRLRLRLFVDTSSVEVFVNDGEAVLTNLILPPPGPRSLELEVTRGALAGAKFLAWELKSASGAR